MRGTKLVRQEHIHNNFFAGKDGEEILKLLRRYKIKRVCWKMLNLTVRECKNRDGISELQSHRSTITIFWQSVRYRENLK